MSCCLGALRTAHLSRTSTNSYSRNIARKTRWKSLKPKTSTGRQRKKMYNRSHPLKASASCPRFPSRSPTHSMAPLYTPLIHSVWIHLSHPGEQRIICLNLIRLIKPQIPVLIPQNKALNYLQCPFNNGDNTNLCSLPVPFLALKKSSFRLRHHRFQAFKVLSLKIVWNADSNQ